MLCEKVILFIKKKNKWLKLEKLDHLTVDKYHGHKPVMEITIKLYLSNVFYPFFLRMEIFPPYYFYKSV